MIEQNYLINDNYLFILDYIPEINIKQSGFIILPGLGENLCDLDYFMKNIATDIYLNGYRVIQIDLYGHGESEGTFKELKRERIIDNLIDCINYLKLEEINCINIISRGITTSFIIQSAKIMSQINKLVGISPIKLVHNDIVFLRESHVQFSGDIEIYYLYKNKDILNKFIILLGSEPFNLYPEIISKQFLDEIFITLEHTVDLNNNQLFISYNLDKKIYMVQFGFDKLKEKTLDYYIGYGLRRDIESESLLRLQIVSTICRLFS